MPEPRLIVHVGTQKTGSTVIQYALRATAWRLKREGIVHVPPPPELSGKCLTDDWGDSLVDAVRRPLLRAADRNRRARTFVLSHEGLSGNPYTGYENAGMVAEALKAMVEGFDTRIVLYLRRQDDFAESAYAQMIREGASQTFEEFTHGLPPMAYDWYRHVEHYAERFGKDAVVVRRYDKTYLPSDTSILEDFAGIVGSDLIAHADTPVRMNEGLGRDALEVVRVCNPLLDPEQRLVMRRILQATHSKRPFERYSLFEPDARKAFMGRFRDSNRAVAIEYLDDPSGVLFPEPKQGSDAPRPYEGLSVEAACQTLMLSLVGLEAERPPDTLFLRVVGKVEGYVRRLLDRFPGSKAALKRRLRW